MGRLSLKVYHLFKFLSHFLCLDVFTAGLDVLHSMATAQTTTTAKAT